MNIGLNIREIATKKKISAIELAEMLGKSRQAIYDIYSGKVSVNIDLLEKIASSLDEPIVNFFSDQAKPIIDRQALKEVIVEIIREVLTKYYLHYTELQGLIKDIHDKARLGEGLVHLRIKRSDDGVILIPEYRKLQSKISEKDLSVYADKLLDDFFNSHGPLGDRLGLKSLINKYFDEKGEGYIIKLLV